jgi:hypothetical protein
MNRITIALGFVLITLSPVHAQSSDWNKQYREQVERALDVANPFVSDSQKEQIRNEYLEYLRHQEQQRIQQQRQRYEIERDRQRY